MNPYVILLGGKDALLARETLVTNLYIDIYIDTQDIFIKQCYEKTFLTTTDVALGIYIKHYQYCWGAVASWTLLLPRDTVVFFGETLNSHSAPLYPRA